MSTCGHCNETFDRRKSPSIVCSGFCAKTYQAVCVGVSAEFLQCLKSPGFCWYCPDCYKIRNKYEGYMKTSFDAKLSQMIGEFETMFSDLISNISEKAKDCFSKLDLSHKVIEDAPTYSNIVNSKSMVVVKPKNIEQTNSKTKIDIMKNIDPVNLNLKVSQVKQIKDGGILISCNDPEGASNFKKAATEKLSSNYNISDVKRFLPKVKIVGLMENYSADDMLKYLKGQNDIFSDESQVKILKSWATNKDPNIFQALVELDAATYGLVMERGKLFINYDACIVYDATDIRICYKCSGFNHGQSYCSQKKTVCPKCSGNHPLNTCTSSVRKCINCTNANLTDTDHAVWEAEKCPIYKKKLNYLKSSAFVVK